MGVTTKNNISLFALLLIIFSYSIPFVTLKENRVVTGVSYATWDIIPLPILLVVLGALLCIVGYAATRQQSTTTAAIYFFAALFVVLWSSMLIARTQPLAYALGKSSRVNPHGGFWLSLYGSILLAKQSAEITKRKGNALLPWVIPLVVALFVAFGYFEHVGILKEFANNRQRFLRELSNHLFLTVVSVGFATAIGIPCGIIAWRHKKIGKIIFPVVNAIQTIPSLALFGIIIAPLAILTRLVPFLRALGIKGIGNAPAIIALSLYALLPIVQNTYSGLANIPHAIIDAGTGMGMNRSQIWKYIERPLSFVVVFTGFRTATVQTIGNTTVAALIGAAGLGNFVFRGLGQAASDLILLGVIPIVLIAMLMNGILIGVGVALQKAALRA